MRKYPPFLTGCAMGAVAALPLHDASRGASAYPVFVMLPSIDGSDEPARANAPVPWPIVERPTATLSILNLSVGGANDFLWIDPA
jgi:hypothetical protein